MSKVKTVTVYKASDGREFDSAEDAGRYEKLKTATDEFEAAAYRLNLALAATLKTADGQPLQLNGRLYFIVRHNDGDAGVTSECLWPRDCEIEQTEIGTYLHYRERGTEKKRYDLGNIYSSERAAKLKVLEMKRRRAQRLAEDIARLEKYVAGLGD